MLMVPEVYQYVRYHDGYGVWFVIFGHMFYLCILTFSVVIAYWDMRCGSFQ